MTNESFKAAAAARIVEWQHEVEFLCGLEAKLSWELKRLQDHIAMRKQAIKSEKFSTPWAERNKL